MRIYGVDEAIKHLKDYRNSLQDKQRELTDKLAQIGVEVAGVKFAFAQYDGTNDVSVRSEWISETELHIIARGKAVAFIEFGTGNHYTEQHPKATDFVAIRGFYGYGLGRFDSWRYKGNPGTNGEVITDGTHQGEVLTHGNPPARAMYDAGKEMRNRIAEIAEGVFRNG